MDLGGLEIVIGFAYYSPPYNTQSLSCLAPMRFESKDLHLRLAALLFSKLALNSFLRPSLYEC